MPDLNSLSPDQALALKTAARNLTDEYSGIFGKETIELFLVSSCDQFSDRATFTNFLPLSGLPQVKAAFGRDDKELACRFFCVPMPEEQGMGLAKHLFAAYGTVPVYAAFFRWLGWADQLDPMVEAWQGGDRKKAVELCPEDLVREIFVFGSPEEMKERLGRFAGGGITTLILTPIAAPDQLPAFIDAMAPAS